MIPYGAVIKQSIPRISLLSQGLQATAQSRQHDKRWKMLHVGLVDSSKLSAGYFRLAQSVRTKSSFQATYLLSIGLGFLDLLQANLDRWDVPAERLDFNLPSKCLCTGKVSSRDE
mmetsp:Transcript_31380/g.56878  ORF Transcript_31380/g.56878 Transcript_31380/m.56878 type:complete len:115 (+) Transcript_31380:1663-2007(+)